MNLTGLTRKHAEGTYVYVAFGCMYVSTYVVLYVHMHI